VRAPAPAPLPPSDAAAAHARGRPARGPPIRPSRVAPPPPASLKSRRRPRARAAAPARARAAAAARPSGARAAARAPRAPAPPPPPPTWPRATIFWTSSAAAPSRRRASCATALRAACLPASRSRGAPWRACTRAGRTLGARRRSCGGSRVRSGPRPGAGWSRGAGGTRARQLVLRAAHTGMSATPTAFASSWSPAAPSPRPPRHAGHPGVLQLVEAREDEDHVHLVMELCQGGELVDRIIDQVGVRPAGRGAAGLGLGSGRGRGRAGARPAPSAHTPRPHHRAQRGRAASRRPKRRASRGRCWRWWRTRTTWAASTGTSRWGGTEGPC
jgi:hypothetical protein